MKVLLLTHGVYLQRDTVVAGNTVRAYYLTKALVEQGIEVVYVYPAELDTYVKTQRAAHVQGVTICAFRNQAEFADILISTQPDAVFVGYWELLELLPDHCKVPVIVDVLAPRVLETRFQGIALEREIQRMLSLYRKADRFVCGNERQRHFLIPWLLLAGFDCRGDVPIEVIPISSYPGTPHPEISKGHVWRLVYGGVSWPWRGWESYREAVIQTLSITGGMPGKLLEVSGSYIYSPSAVQGIHRDSRVATGDSVVEELPLLGYQEMELLFTKQCDIGIELAERNVEREFSQSFRAIEYLRCGLPIICNDYLELARRIRDYDAGWLVSESHDIPMLLKHIASHPHEYRLKSVNAIRLVDECFHYRKTIQPLLRYLENPARAQREKDVNVIGVEDCGLQTPTGPTVETSNHSEFKNLLHRFWNLLRLPAQREVRKTSDPVGKRIARYVRGIVAGLYRYIIKPVVFGRTGRHIAIVTRKDVFPTNHGAAVKVERSAWGESFSVDSVFLITGDWVRYYVYERGTIREEFYPWVFRFFAFFTYRAARKLARIGIPEREAFLYHPFIDWGYFLRLVFFAYRFNIVLYQAEFPGYALPCIWVNRIFPGKTLLVEHNVEFIRLSEQYPYMSARAAGWLRDKELEMCLRVDTVVTVSEGDRQTLIANAIPPEKVHYISLGVDLDLYKRDYQFDIRRAYHIQPDVPILVYHGIYGYRPNLEAVRILAAEILPRLAMRGLKVKVLAIGKDQPSVSFHPDVIFTGPVENLAPYIKNADLAVVTLQKGGGTRMKILEYFAAGIPVVTTSKAVEGIPIENHIHAWIEDDYDRMANAIIELLINREYAQNLAAAGLRFVEKLDWRTIAQRYVELMGICLV
jgi:glycosyltransferase involved in cell wall biosynthesis